MNLLKSLFILLLFAGFEARAQNYTPNIGFEDGTFDNWECYIGNIDKAGNITVAASNPTANRQVLYGKESAGILDPYGKFPVLCPNGSKYSMRPGNSDTSAQAERVTYTFKVPNGSAYSILFNYAVVLENPAHFPYQQPKFVAQVYDVTDSKYIDCPSFDFVASSNLPGFKLSSLEGRMSSIYYKEWSTASIDLRGYLGKTIRLEFTTNDCTEGGHFGYAYLDLDENIGSPVTGNTYCEGQKSITLFAPNGFAEYYWYNADMSKQIGFGQSLKISPPPPDNTTYALKIFPYSGLGCVDTVYTVVSKINEGFKLNVLDTIHQCPHTAVDLTAAAVTAGSSPGMTLSYYTDSLATTYVYHPDSVTTPGVYYIQGINAEGCMNVLPVHVVMSPAVITVTNPAPIDFPGTVDISKSFIPVNGQTYSYYTNAKATSPLKNYTAIGNSGKFYIKAVNKFGCDTIAPVNVEIDPPPPYIITAPSAFTPNNDGINDYFSVTVKGIVTFGSVSIYNRYGQLMFTTKSPNGQWDGNFNGAKLPDGTYYWIFEGEDGYYKKKINRGGSVTIVR